MSKPPLTPFSPEQAFEFMQKMWNPFGLPMPGVAPPAAGTPAAPAPFPHPLSMFATIDPAEVDKKIAELRVIENWLAMSLDFMQMSIKTLELQKASLEALRAAATPAPQSTQPPPKRHKPKEGQ